MSRRPVATRVASDADIPALVDLWSELAQAGGRVTRAVYREQPHSVAERLRGLLADPRARVVVAEADGAVAGMAVLCHQSLGPLSDETAVHVSHVVVAGGQRHRGVGRALVGCAAEFAERVGVDNVTVNVPPALREANRFYARLGFAPLAVRRAAAVGQLRRRLAAPDRRPLVTPFVRTRRRVTVPVQPVEPAPAVAAGEGVD